MRASVLIRRPVADVFAAFADPAITTRFWFTDSTGPLGPGAKVEWTWAMYATSADVTVRAFEPNERIVFDWDGGDGATEVDWRFTAESDELTHVEVTETGFAGTADQMVARAIDSTGGFSKMLASAKALLEHDVLLDVVSDK